MRNFFLLAFTVQLALAGTMSAKAPVVVQLFDWNFRQVSEVLPELERIGYTHIHLSPMQKSVENGKWWGKYQPLDFRKIEGPLGTREELKALAAEAKQHGITLVADVVINHMAATPHITVTRGRLREVHFDDFSKEDFHPFAPIHDWTNELQVRNRWLFGALPDLRTESPTVRQKLVNHLVDLQDCGVGGFRVDSARHIPPEDLQAILDGVSNPGLVMGEIAEKRLSVFEPYLEALPGVTYFDFPYLALFAACLRGERPMSDLTQKGELVERLPVEASVRLLRNHDLDRGEAKRTEGINDPRYRLPDQGWQLGYTALFGMRKGIPYVFVDHPEVEKPPGREHSFDRAGLRESLAFFQETQGKELHVFWSVEETLAWTVGQRAFVVLSRQPASRKESFPLPKMKPGRYRDLLSGHEVSLEKGVLTLPPLGELQGYLFEHREE